VKAMELLEQPRKRKRIVGRSVMAGGLAILGLSLACSSGSPKAEPQETEKVVAAGSVAVPAGSAVAATVVSAAAPGAPAAPPPPVESPAESPAMPPPGSTPPADAAGASANTPPSPTVKVTVSVFPRVAATVSMGRKRLGNTARGPLVIERPRDSGPLDLIIRAPGYIPVHTRAYTFESNTIEVRLTRVDKKDTLFGYRQPLPPEEGVGGAGGAGGAAASAGTGGAAPSIVSAATPAVAPARPTAVAPAPSPPSAGGRSGARP